MASLGNIPVGHTPDYEETRNWVEKLRRQCTGQGNIPTFSMTLRRGDYSVRYGKYTFTCPSDQSQKTFNLTLGWNQEDFKSKCNFLVGTTLKVISGQEGHERVFLPFSGSLSSAPNFGNSEEKITIRYKNEFRTMPVAISKEQDPNLKRINLECLFNSTLEFSLIEGEPKVTCVPKEAATIQKEESATSNDNSINQEETVTRADLKKSNMKFTVTNRKLTRSEQMRNLIEKKRSAQNELDRLLQKDSLSEAERRRLDFLLNERHEASANRIDKEAAKMSSKPTEGLTGQKEEVANRIAEEAAKMSSKPTEGLTRQKEKVASSTDVSIEETSSLEKKRRAEERAQLKANREQLKKALKEQFSFQDTIEALIARQERGELDKQGAELLQSLLKDIEEMKQKLETAN